MAYPIYASTNYQGDDTYEHIFTDRDGRMGQTILKTGDLLSDDPNFATWIKKSDGYGYFTALKFSRPKKKIVIRPDTVCAKD